MNDQRKEQLIEQYEEVTLSLLMEEYADAEGARLLQEFEEASAQGTIAPMPQELDAKCQKIINQAYQKHRRHTLLSHITKAVGKVAVVALMLFGLASVTILSVDAWRVPVLNYILDQEGISASLDFENAGSQSQQKNEEILDLVLGCVPKEYKLSNQPDPNGLEMTLQFQDSIGGRILIAVSESTSDFVVDIENAEYVELEIGGHKAFFVEKDGWYIIWCDEGENLTYSIYSNNLTADEFWALAYTLAE